MTIDDGADRVGPVNRIRAAVQHGDMTEVARLVEERPIEVWFSLPPGTLHDLLSKLPPEVVRHDSVGGFLLGVATGLPLETRISADPTWAAALEANDELRRAWVFLQSLQARVAGDAQRSWEVLAPLVAAPIRSPLYADVSGGLDTLVRAQAALSAALAGQIAEAIALYDSVLLHAPRDPELVFFLREAYVRSALLQALYGTRGDARTRAEQSRRIRRTGSWVEDLLDVELELVEAVLAPPDELGDAMERVLALPLQHIGEIWPFFIIVVQRLTISAGQRRRGRDRIAALHAAGMGLRGDGTGLPASAFHIAFAWDDLLTGHRSRAAAEIAAIDSRLVDGVLLAGFHAVAVGAPTRGLQLARSLRDSVRGLDQAESARLLLVALCHHAMDAENEAVAVLRELAPRLNTTTVALLAQVSQSIVRLGAARVPGWPGIDLGVHDSGRGVFDSDVLSPRELDVLAAMAEGKNRDEIARKLFVSVNTVKTHQRSLYRKLGASSGATALIAASRRGLI